MLDKPTTNVGIINFGKIRVIVFDIKFVIELFGVK
jgi:hypothetical protein